MGGVAEAAGISRVTLHRIYERNWRHLDPKTLSADEQGLIDALRLALGSDPVV